ncbi:hypothetical protein [Streptomyces sp. NPDC052012]|uniref:hypothetical protein n=1 Tax=Streptomyces sp. NPDC052012 TaxID=3155051 RepID=UPI00344C7DA9
MRAVSKVVLTGSAVAGLVLAAVPAAVGAAAGPSARPTGCHYEVANASMTVANCENSNGGHYRAVALCKEADTGAYKEFVGDWRNNGGWSKAYCGGSYRVSSAGIDTKVN